MSSERLVIETLLRIPNKEGEDVDFLLNKDQAAFDAAWTGRDIIAKYRQGGFSTYPLGRALVRCLGYRNRRHVILAHNTDTTQKLLSRIHYMIKHLKGPEPDLKHSTQNRIVFNKTDSHIFIGTAGSDDYGVGDTVTDLHCSEVPRWPNPQALLTGLFQAVPPSGNILVEATGRGMGNWFHKAVMQAASGHGSYKLHFFNWLNTPEYSVPMTPFEEKRFLDNLDLTLEEDKYHEMGLTASQLAWRRIKIEELQYDLRAFKENYPVTLDECFQSTGYGVFATINFKKAPTWHVVDPWTRVLGEHPLPQTAYVAGADVAAGVGLDYSVLEIFDAVTGEQVLEYRNHMIEPDRFAEKAAELLRRFNNCYVNPERNNHGILFIKTLLGLYPSNRIHQGRSRLPSDRAPASEVATLADYGTYTTQVMKALMIGALRTQARSELTIHSEILLLEMGSFVEKETGAMEAENGCFDDCVMASALAAFVRAKAATVFHLEAQRKAAAFRGTTVQLFEAGRAINELESRYRKTEIGEVPISSGVSGYW